MFAEDAERAHQQALNTDIRQGTFEGFELPDVFLAAVQSTCGTATPELAASKRPARGSTAALTPVAPMQGLFQDEFLETPDAPPAEPVLREKAIAAMPAATARLASISTSAAPESPARASFGVASARVEHDRDGMEDTSGPSVSQRASRNAAPELDRARATAFADTIDALYAVIAEQRTSTAAHARRLKTMLTIIVCVMLGTVATGIAQTVVLMHMSRDGKLQQDRMEQLMLSQQATLASLFDTDSATVSMRQSPDRPREADDASPVQPVSAAGAARVTNADSAPKKHTRQPHHRAGSSAH
ncbi:hypothetical protein [Caballeronia hypogeia]|uniref:hypothetical protein n=1 Tax=Caballeronia hypogeia TaxID=1777140 RepID=UPI001E2D0267|nr:hypothetical protein [Caballeronia hypogeia]